MRPLSVSPAAYTLVRSLTKSMLCAGSSGTSAWPSKQATLLKPALNSQPRGRVRPSLALSSRIARPSGVSNGPTRLIGLSLRLFQLAAASSGAGEASGAATPGAPSVFRPALAAASHSSVATEISELSVGGLQLPLVSAQAKRWCSLLLSRAPSLSVPRAAYKSSADPPQRAGQPVLLFAVLLLPSSIRRS